MASGLPAPKARLILHVTHARQLSTILIDGAILPDAAVGDRLQHEIGDREIKTNRRKFSITCGPGGLRWVFSDGNCGSMLTGYYDDLADLDCKIDWPLQHATIWKSTAEDPDL